MELKQVREMLELQEKLETRIDGANWRHKNHNYPLAIFMECAEVIDYVGWKHWKKQETQYDAIVGELIDIWHFAMAHILMVEGEDLDEIAERLYVQLEESTKAVRNFEVQGEITVQDVMIDASLGIADRCITQFEFPLSNFVLLCSLCKLDFNSMYRLYVSKNVLNWFRQDNGYKTGEYKWSTKEDNEYLYSIAGEMSDEDFNATELYKLLDIKYNLLTATR